MSEKLKKVLMQPLFLDEHYIPNGGTGYAMVLGNSRIDEELNTLFEGESTGQKVVEAKWLLHSICPYDEYGFLLSNKLHDIIVCKHTRCEDMIKAIEVMSVLGYGVFIDTLITLLSRDEEIAVYVVDALKCAQAISPAQFKRMQEFKNCSMGTKPIEERAQDVLSFWRVRTLYQAVEIKLEGDGDL